MDDRTDLRTEDLTWSLLLLGFSMFRVPEDIFYEEGPHDETPVYP